MVPASLLEYRIQRLSSICYTSQESNPSTNDFQNFQNIHSLKSNNIIFNFEYIFKSRSLHIFNNILLEADLYLSSSVHIFEDPCEFFSTVTVPLIFE